MDFVVERCCADDLGTYHSLAKSNLCWSGRSVHLGTSLQDQELK